MHITGIFKLDLIFIKLLQSREHLYHTSIKCENDKLEDWKPLELLFLRGFLGLNW